MFTMFYGYNSLSLLFLFHSKTDFIPGYD